MQVQLFMRMRAYKRCQATPHDVICTLLCLEVCKFVVFAPDRHITPGQSRRERAQRRVREDTLVQLTELEHVNRKSFRTITGLLIRKALLHTRGTLGMPHERKLNFLHSFQSLPRQLLLSLLSHPPSSGIIPRLQSLLTEYDLPPINHVISGQWTSGGWKRLARRLLLAKDFFEFVANCSHLSKCSPTSLSAADSQDSRGSTTAESDFY